LCKQTVALVILSTNSTFALMGLRKTLHLADKMPKAFSIVRLAREGLKLKTRWGSSRFFPGNGFINQGLRGKMSSPRNTYVRFWPSTGTGLGRFNLVGTSSNAVPYKVSDRTLASSMLPYASISKNVKQYLASHTACKTILYMKTFIVKIGRADLFRAFNVCVLPVNCTDAVWEIPLSQTLQQFLSNHVFQWVGLSISC